MKTRFVLLFFLLISAVAQLFAVTGDVIDRLVATVNGHVILQSDWEDEVRYEAFCNARPLEQISPDERKVALDRLIDQELLREQMTSADSQHLTDDSINSRVAEIRKMWHEAKTEEDWRNALGSYGLTESQLKIRIRAELNLMDFVDAKLAPSVKIDSASVESYYNQELLPSIQETGSAPQTLANASTQIKELLTQKRMNELLVAWLQKLRSDSRVQTQTESEPR